MESFTERVISIIKNIPSGTVMTYGQIARQAGSPRGARQVVRILHSMSKKHKLPWYRVINSKGQIGIQDEETYFAQVQFLREEGILVKDGEINLTKYQYTPDEID